MTKKTAKDYVNFSDFGWKVFEICDTVWDGIYHLPDKVQHKTDWANSQCIYFNLNTWLATWDTNKLTELVILCHDSCIRLEIQPRMKNLRLLFHPRKNRDGRMSQRHPSIEDAIISARKRHVVQEITL